jgi:hypothetical protein
MSNTEFPKTIPNMTDAELDSQLSTAHNLLFGECFCGDDEARAEAVDRYQALAREWKSRKRP